MPINWNALGKLALKEPPPFLATPKPFPFSQIAIKPKFWFCGICGDWHPAGFDDDCREDDSRFTYDQLDTKYGAGGWEEIDRPDD